MLLSGSPFNPLLPSMVALPRFTPAPKRVPLNPLCPTAGKKGWQWYYDGMYGEQPFIATGPLAGAPEFGNGNLFNAGKAAMGLTQTWYTCCLGDFKTAGLEFQLGIQPIGANGEVAGAWMLTPSVF